MLKPFNNWRPNLATATLLLGLGMPLTACAQQAEVGQAETVNQQVDSGQVDDDSVASTEHAVEAQAEQKSGIKEKADEELAELQAEANLRKAKLQAAIAPLQEEKARLEAKLEVLQARQEAAQAEAKLAHEQKVFEHQIALAKAQLEAERLGAELKLAQLQAQLAAAKQARELAKVSARNQQLATETAALNAELERAATQRKYDSVARDGIAYPTKPFKDGVLTISDRRIPLNGAIGKGTADYITQRIHYFNNLDSEAPIFIVIDSSPGGSLMEGFRILTAMKNSDAPVHVIVKSWAASMAACITTLADESYCYPNAVILHHQASSSMRGNLTQQSEQLEEVTEWARRLAEPVADKMGITYQEFVKQMYKNNSNGDWSEFGDVAQELKWVNHVVERIRETALVSAPVGKGPQYRILQQANGERKNDHGEVRGLSQWDLFNSPIQFETAVDGNGRAYIELPALDPFDYYFMYDPKQQYRVAP